MIWCLKHYKTSNSDTLYDIGQAHRLANLSVWEFQQLLGQQKIERHYHEADLDQNISTITVGFGSCDRRL